MTPRPIRFRHGVRVLLVAGAEVLLINDSDPGVPGSSWWVTPGGGIDGTESVVVAACREVAEETGAELTASQLHGPLGQGIAVHGYSDRILVQEEQFHRAEVPRFTPRTSGWTPKERTRMKGLAWHRLDDLPDALWPARLPELLRATPERPLTLGRREESTVPLTAREWQLVNEALWRDGC